MDITRESNTKIRSMMFFSDKDRAALYSQQKHDLEMTVAQIMSSLLEHSAQVKESRENQ